MFNKSVFRREADENTVTHSKSKEVKCDLFFFVIREAGMENQEFREGERKNRSKVFIYSHFNLEKEISPLSTPRTQRRARAGTIYG